MAFTDNTKYFRAKAFIFDLDGTNTLVERFWHQFASENGLDSDKIPEEFEKRLAEESEGVSLMKFEYVKNVI